MAAKKTPATGGVDTHGQTHHAAAVDQTGRVLGDHEFPATAAGYRALLVWLRSHGKLVKVGVEGTGTCGASLARYLASEKVTLVEVDRPDRKTRRAKGKSDPIDAIAAARAALSGQADGAPKTRIGPVEAIRALRVARRGAIKARTAALNQLHGLAVAAPQELRDELDAQPSATLVAYCAGLTVDDEQMADPAEATRAALRAIAQRVQHLDAEGAQADQRLRPVVAKTAPRLSALFGVGPEVAGQLLATAGDNPDRLRSEAALAHLCGVAPSQPAPDARTLTASTAAATAPPTAPSTRSCSAACATTRAPATTSTVAPSKASARKRSSDASSATSSAKSTPRYSPTSRSSTQPKES